MGAITGRLVGAAGPTALAVPTVGQIVESVVALRALVGSAILPAVTLLQYALAAPGRGGGVFVWSETAATDDGVLAFNAGGLGSSGAGWRRVFSGAVNADWAGLDDAAADNVAALQRALDAGAGGVVDVPAGDYAVASASLPLVLPANTSLRGAGSLTTVLTVTGAAVNNLFTATDVGGVALHDLQAVGNSSALSDAGGQALYVVNSTATAMRGVRVTDCLFDNFGGDYWIEVYQSDPGGEVSDVEVARCTFLSRTGNCRVPDSLSATSVCVKLHGAADPAGLVRDVRIVDNYADCTFIKGFAWAYNNVADLTVRGNTVDNAGADAAILADCGAYAVMAYNSTPGYANPTRVTISENRLVAPKSCGVYAAGVDEVAVTGNFITGQTDATGTTLPKGAVALNGCARAQVCRNTLLDNRFGVWVVTKSDAVCSADVTGNTIVSAADWAAPSGACGVIVAPSTTGTQYGDVRVADNMIHVTGTDVRAVFVSCKSTEALRSIRIERNDLRATYNCVNFYSGDGSSPNIGQAIIADNSLYSTGANALLMPGMQDTAIRIERNDFVGGWDGSTAYVCDVNLSHNLTLLDNTFRQFTAGTGKMLNTTDARGTVRGSVFDTVADARRYVYAGGEVLGVDAPTWSATAGAVVESLAAEAHKFWTYDAAWKVVPSAGQLAPGSTSLAAGEWHIQYQRLQLTGTQRLTLAGTARYILTDL